ncbi:hypothetical protein San01_29980 [Streptomyces angustmyceticus]|uniref:Uncharacterized protein n=1 Tax=Streptomyces angustmyceticus TaxID=285578 RepID=A0A5J4LF11_9ACTN|nr:hypothetical protein San01_29980 [Streptomyces angustmyceticus]
MSLGSILAYELTQSMATNGAIRQTPATTRVGVTTCLRSGDAAGCVMAVAPSPGGLLWLIGWNLWQGRGARH